MKSVAVRYEINSQQFYCREEVEIVAASAGSEYVHICLKMPPKMRVSSFRDESKELAV